LWRAEGTRTEIDAPTQKHAKDWSPAFGALYWGMDMKRRALVSLAAVAVLLLSAGRASAEEDPGLGLRIGMSLQGGPLIVPGVGTVGVGGAEVQAGVQFNRFLGLYAVLDLDFVVGKLSPGNPPHNEALLVEFAFGNRLFVGVGPEMGFYDVTLWIAGGPPMRSGYLYGGRLHVAWSLASRDRGPLWLNVFGYGDMLTLGLNVRVLGGVARYMGAVDTSGTATANPLSLLPMLTLNYSIR
jgi:hypothetical protein